MKLSEAITPEERTALRLDPYAWPFLDEEDVHQLECDFEGDDYRPWMRVHYHVNSSGSGSWVLTLTDTGDEKEFDTLTEALDGLRACEVQS